MGTRGPPPAPTRVLQLRGSWRANRNKDEPKAERGRPRCPKWILKEGQNVWKRLVEQLDNMGILTHADENALARYCQLWARWRKAEEHLKKFGMCQIVKESHGYGKKQWTSTMRQPWPEVKIASELSAQLTKIEQTFGLTPSARARLTQIDAPKDNDDKLRHLRLG